MVEEIREHPELLNSISTAVLRLITLSGCYVFLRFKF